MREHYIPSWVNQDETPEAIPLADERVIIKPFKTAVIVDDEKIHLRPKEYQILLACGLEADQYVSYAKLVSTIWGYPEPDASVVKTLQVMVNTLRNKLPDSLRDVNAGVLRVQRAMGYKAVTHL